MSLLGDKLKEAGIYKPDNERIWNWLRDQANPRTIREIGMALSMDFPPIEVHLKDMCKRDMVVETVRQFHGHAHTNVATFQYNTTPGLKEFDLLPYRQVGVIAKATAETLPSTPTPKDQKLSNKNVPRLSRERSTAMLQMVHNAPKGIYAIDIARALKVSNSGVNVDLKYHWENKTIMRKRVSGGFVYYSKVHEAAVEAFYGTPQKEGANSARLILTQPTVTASKTPTVVPPSDTITIKDLDSVLAKMPLGVAQEMYFKLHKIFGKGN